MELSQNFVVTGSSGDIETSFFYPVRLDQGFELALGSFHCGPICNVNNEFDLLYLVKGSDEVIEEKLLEIPHGYFHTTGGVLTILHRTINTFIGNNSEVWGTEKCELKYNATKRIWTLNLPTTVSIAHCTKYNRNVMNLFVLEDGNYTQLIVIEEPFDEGVETGFVYSSVVEESYINGYQSRLLAAIPLRTNSLYTQYEPNQLKYYKIAIEEFSSIFIEIRNSRGHFIEFADEGNAIACPNHDNVFAGSSTAIGSKKDHVIICLTLKNLFK